MSKPYRINGNSKDTNPEKANNTSKEGGAKAIQMNGIYIGEEATEAQRNLLLVNKRLIDEHHVMMLDSPLKVTSGNSAVWQRCLVMWTMQAANSAVGLIVSPTTHLH
jgi:hypothetical protein